MGEGESHVTRTGLVMGTPGFIAPEIIDGAESDDATRLVVGGVRARFCRNRRAVLRHQADDGGT